MTKQQKELLFEFFRCGAVVLKGHELKVHKHSPELEKAPVYFNLRAPENPAPGPLAEEHLRDIGRELRTLAQKLGLKYGWVAGIPNAGTEIARGMSSLIMPRLPQLILQKNYYPATIDQLLAGQDELLIRILRRAPGLLIDDVVGAASSKLPWIECLANLGVNLSALIVVIDREEGGAEEIWKRFELETYSIFQLRPLLRFALNRGFVGESVCDRALRFRRKVIALKAPSETEG